VVLDVKGYPDYQVDKVGKFLVVKVKDPTYGNISYHSNGDRVYFSLKWTQLTQNEAEIKKLYTGKYDSTGKKYTIVFNGYYHEFKNGNLKINDNYIDSVDINGNAINGTTTLTFNAKDKFVYEIITRYDTSGNVMDTAVTLLKPAAKADKLVVIDPGHGGYETGAVANGMLEKQLNLDIANRLNSLLKAKGVKTYMIREDDSYIGLFERAYIANDLNASLFVSIHNNAWNASAKGTETLYNTSDPNAAQLNSIKFAQIMQPYLVNTLGTFDRRIVERPGLVVLRKTLMPAILTEIAFMDSKEDAARLQTNDFRQKAAQALCDGITKALGELQ
jgi:N-acetylmuramoyl-L-alanine amidase